MCLIVCLCVCLFASVFRSVYRIEVVQECVSLCCSLSDGFGSSSVPVPVEVYRCISVHIFDDFGVSLFDSSRRVGLCFSYWRKSGVRLA